MPGTSTPIYPQTLKGWYAQLLNGTGAYTLPTAAQTTLTGLVPLVVGDTNGDKIESLSVVSTDTVVQSLVFVIVTASNSYVCGVVAVPAGAGASSAIPPVDILNGALIPGLPFDANGNQYFYVPPGSTLYVGTLVVVTSAKTIDLIGQGGAF